MTWSPCRCAACENESVSELRWHPLLREWVGVAGKRQNRPQMPKDWCPFCPGSGRVPDHYETYLYPNDFAAFSKEYPPFEDNPGLFHKTGARGQCDVVLYHPNHNLTPANMSTEHWGKVIDLWTSRTKELWPDPDFAYIYIFENTGEAIGVTMPHPHGQLYAMPFIPPLVQRELQSAGEYFAKENECLYCSLLRGELQAASRIVLETKSFVAFVPFAARWPGEIQLYPRRHFTGLQDMTGEEHADLALAIKTVRLKYDHLWNFAIPLMMMVRQAPPRTDAAFFHFHIEFCPIQRSATKLKYLAGVESGTGTFLNDTIAEEKATELRDVVVNL